jgi:hypothetical protein
LNVSVSRLSATNVLMVSTSLAGVAVSVAALSDEPRMTSVALGAAVTLGALLVRSVARDLGTAIQRHARRTEVVRRQLTRGMRNQREAMEAQVSTMTRRVLGDLNAARLEQLDEQDAPGPD